MSRVPPPPSPTKLPLNSPISIALGASQISKKLFKATRNFSDFPKSLCGLSVSFHSFRKYSFALPRSFRTSSKCLFSSGPLQLSQGSFRAYQSYFTLPEYLLMTFESRFIHSQNIFSLGLFLSSCIAPSLLL